MIRGYAYIVTGPTTASFLPWVSSRPMVDTVTFRLLPRFLHPFHLDLLATTSWLQNLSMELGLFKEAAAYAHELTAAYEAIYPANHPSIGLQW